MDIMGGILSYDLIFSQMRTKFVHKLKQVYVQDIDHNMIICVIVHNDWRAALHEETS